MPTFTVIIETSVDAEYGTPLDVREIARKGWDEIARLQAPVVKVIEPDGDIHEVDFEEESEVKQAQAFYAEHGYAEGMTCQKCGAPPEVTRPDGKGEQVGYCGEHEPDDQS